MVHHYLIGQAFQLPTCLVVPVIPSPAVKDSGGHGAFVRRVSGADVCPVLAQVNEKVDGRVEDQEEVDTAAATAAGAEAAESAAVAAAAASASLSIHHIK